MMTIPRQLLHPRYWPTWLGVVCMFVLATLPQRANYLIGCFLGDLFYRFAGRRRHIAATNLALCFPELGEVERRALLKQTMRNQGIGLMETLRTWFTPVERLGVTLELVGERYLDEPEGGVIVLGSHFTSIDVGGALLGQRFPSDSFYRRQKNPVLEWLMSRARGRYGEPIHRRDFKRALKRLRQGHRLFYLPDQDYGRKSADFVSFFGVPAATTLATTTLAKSGRAQVVFVDQQRLDRGRRIRLEFIPLADIPSDDPTRDAQAVMAQVEKNIRRAPEQYMWVHRRFKTRPPGAEKVY
ncbi:MULTISPECIES: lipid A biosynthesis lauroyl acyltransferase [Spongiibacter]|uniref:LpxL/LpxP family acyltransferase n=1 Tax=Spongiibacter TaxID=630749 RepID=UPI001B0C67CA|nr:MULTISPECIES: lipid A biosynthesis lauroyl acyltransferase [Spongiibacter]MBO6753625.1 lipid A biosynthesis lauroyl acyltransferase [Spongiibacter sp.]